MQQKNIERIVRDFFQSQSSIRLVFLFGSASKGRLTNESDIDIAVLFEKTPDYFQIQQIAGKLEETLQREVDLVVLNAASPILRMQVLKYGSLIIGSDSNDFKKFFGDTINQYEDLKRIRSAGEKNILKGGIYG
jgi:predicted nucleotidyltransferase